MGWSTIYKIHLDAPIEGFDSAYVDSWCSGQDKFIDLNYMRYQYNDPLAIHVIIKYGRHEIKRVMDMLTDRFGCRGDITIVRTDEWEWPSWRDSYDPDEDY